MGKLFLVAGAAGAGKTTLIREALKSYPEAEYLTTYTTRPQRPNVDEPEYVFVSPATYESLRLLSRAWDHGEYYGQSYGCDVDQANRRLRAGTHLFSAVMPDPAEISRMKQLYDAPSIVILVQSQDEIRRVRLVNRGVVAELERLAADSALSGFAEAIADTVFCPKGDLRVDSKDFCQLIGEYLLCAE